MENNSSINKGNTMDDELEMLYGLDAEWFRKAYAQDPEEKAKIYQEWLNEGSKPRKNNACIRKAMELAAGKSKAAIGFYLSKTGKHSDKLAEETWDRLDSLYQMLGREPMERAKGVIETPQSPKRILILTEELSQIPSMPFHLDVIHGIVKSAKQHNMICPLYEVDRMSTEQDISNAIQHFKLHGAIFIRMSPETKVCDKLKKTKIPAVLLHADRLEYGAPVLANITPNQEPIKKSVRMWANDIRNMATSGKPGLPSNAPVVVVAMAPENLSSIRNERLQFIKQGLEGLNSQFVFVENFQFHQAYRVYNQYPEALAYFCLSDEIGVALKHLLTISGQDPTGRIMGFDNSPIAEAENLSSFGQDANKMGNIALHKILDFYRHGKKWPGKTEEIQTDVYLIPR